ncbi:MAG TPA: peptidyl-prolyl cis-trans isomerase [Planctomycetota bacterium]|nr:peptidyl-prolyl cis-trans isomerase [Planctomycetota bacterium]
MARSRRRVKFQPFRMGEKTRNTILVGLGVFLMAIFAVPFRGSCDRRRVGGRSPSEVYLTYDGKDIRYGQVMEVRRLCHLIYRSDTPLTDDDAALWLTQYYEAERAGIRVSDEEVVDAIRNERFPRRVKVEYVIAEDSSLGKDLPVSDKELEAAYQREKNQRFRGADKSVQPFSEVRELLLSELRSQQGSPLAKAALEALKKTVDAIVGGPLENALKQLANERTLRFGESNVFTARSARGALRPIGEVPGIADRVFRDPIGKVSEPLRLKGGWCVFRVVSRSRGFGRDGGFCPEEEGWVRQGYGVINMKDYDEVLQEMGVTRPELEATERQRLALLVLPGLVGGSLADIPRSTLKARYVRDNTQAVAAYFTVRAADFAQGVSPTEDELRDFYARHKDVSRTASSPGYRQPERVAIEYALGRSADVGAKLTDADLLKYYERNRAFFGHVFNTARDDVRKRLAEDKLMAIIGQIANRAADEVASGRVPNLKALTGAEAREFPGAFTVDTTPPFAASEAPELVSELRGARLAEVLFGERGQQYSVAGAEAKPGTHAISEVFSCDAGRFFFRVTQREEARALPYDNLPEHLRRQLGDDVKNDKAFAKAREKAREYRTRISQAAIERFAERVGTKPLETEFLKPTDPFPGLGKAMPDLYAQLAGGDVGDLSDVVAVGERFVLARLVAREEAKGNRFQLVTCAAQGLAPTYEPALYEQRAAYDAAPHSFLDQPKPIPFEKVKDDIAKLLERRQALRLATERAEKALAELTQPEKPDLAAVAVKHGLRPRSNVAVNLAQPEATPDIGKAAGFRDAVTALKPGEVSRILSSAEGRFLFVLKSRDEKAATLDVAAALYETLRAEAKVDDKEVRQYYDDHRDTAYVTDDEIKDAPSWDAAPAAHERVRGKLEAEWAKKPLPERLAALRDSLVWEAFRTVPSAYPLPVAREMRVSVNTLGPFPVSKPEAFLADEPQAMAAIRALKPGEVTKPLVLATRPGALIALLAERRPGGRARAKVALFRAADFLASVPPPDATAIERHFEANKAAFRVPAQATVEFLFADAAMRQRAIEGRLTDAECRRHFELHADDAYRGHSYEESEYRVRADIARERANREARAAADLALEAVRKARKPSEADFAALAKQFNLLHGKSEPFAVEDPASPTTLGRIADIADVLGDTKPGEIIPRIVQSSQGYAVCRLAARTAPRDSTLAEVRDKVAQALKVQAACDAARKAAEAFRSAAAASSFEKAASRAPKVVETELLDARRFVVPGEGPMPALADAIFALDKPGLTPVAVEAEPMRACVADVSERQPDELLTLEAAMVALREPMLALEEPTTDDLRKHYEANKETFRRPEVAEVESLVAPYADLAKAVAAPSDEELRKEFDRSVRAGELYCRDWSAAVQPAFLPFDKAKDRVRDHLRRAAARVEAGKLLAEALKALQAEGAKADLKAYAAKHPPLVATQPVWIDRERKGLRDIGPAPDLAKTAFAAPKGELAGPVQGSDGACLIRVCDRTPSRVPPLDEPGVKMEVQMDCERARAAQRVAQAADKLREKLSAALAKAGEKDRAEAFRKVVEAEPPMVEVPQPIPVTLSLPFRPLDAYDPQRAARNLIRAELVSAVFGQRPAHMTPVIEDTERTGCCVALVTHFIPPKEPTQGDLFATEYRLYEVTRRMASASWHRYLESRIDRD